MNLYIRHAVPADVPTLTELIQASVRTLQAEDYTEAQREAALRSVFGVDSQLIADGTVSSGRDFQTGGGIARHRRLWRLEQAPNPIWW